MPVALGIRILLARASTEIPAIAPYFKISPARTGAEISAAALKLKAFAQLLDFSGFALPPHRSLGFALFLNLKFTPPVGSEFVLPLNFKSAYVFLGLKFTRAFCNSKFPAPANAVPKILSRHTALQNSASYFTLQILLLRRVARNSPSSLVPQISRLAS